MILASVIATCLEIGSGILRIAESSTESFMVSSIDSWKLIIGLLDFSIE